MEEGMGNSLPTRLRLSNSRRRSRPKHLLQPQSWTSWDSRSIRTLAGSQLGLDRWANALSLSNLDRSTNLLFRLAFPNLKSQSLVSGRKVFACFSVLFFDSIILFAIISYWAGPAIILSSLLAVLVFTVAARRIPANFLATDPSKPARSSRKLAMLAALFFPAALLTGSVSAGVSAPPLLPIVLEALLSFLILRTILRSLGPPENLAGRTAMAIGLVARIMAFGLVASIGASPLILVADVAFGLFLRRTWRVSHTSLLVASGLHTLGPELPRL
jgi:hypothetical protein